VDLNVKSGAVLTVGTLSGGWVWANAFGDPLWEKRDTEYGCTTYRSQSGLEMILDWVDERHGEDTCAEELGNGIVKVLGTFPTTAEEVLDFLRGANGGKPVIPWLDVDEEVMDEEAWERVPWRDIETLSMCTMPEVLNLWAYQTGNNGCSTAEAPDEETATGALVCVGQLAASSEVESAAASCTFFTLGALKEDGEDYFSLSKGGDRGEPLIPYLIICANPLKETIAFVYQCTFWI